MTQVLAWIVAVERHAPGAGDLDFKPPISRHALAWAHWLRTRPGTELLLNIQAREGSAEAAAVQALAPHTRSPGTASLADRTALLASLRQLHGADLLLWLWIGHGVMHEERRCLVHAGSGGADDLQTVDLEALLRRLRRQDAPPRQLGLLDTCAEIVAVAPDLWKPAAGEHATGVRQHVVFAATPGAYVSLNPEAATAASQMLALLQAQPWPPEPGRLDPLLASLGRDLDPQPVQWACTHGAERFTEHTGPATQALARPAPGDDGAGALRMARRSGWPPWAWRHVRSAVDGLPGAPAAATLSRAMQGGTLDALAQRLLRHRDPDVAHTGWVLAQAGRCAQRAWRWLQPAQVLGLGLPRWQTLARTVAALDARDAPQVQALETLLLWVGDLAEDAPAAGDPPRTVRSWLTLLLGAADATARGQGQGGAAAARALRLAIDADPTLGAWRGWVEQHGLATQARPTEPLTVVAALDAPDEGGPRVLQAWEARPVPGGMAWPAIEVPEGGSAAERLHRLVAQVQKREARPVRLELLVPLMWLGRGAELLRYRRDRSALGLPAGIGGPSPTVELHRTLPVVWRWRERLTLRDDTLLGPWLLRTQQCRPRVLGAPPLPCRFDDEPPASPQAREAPLHALPLRPAATRHGGDDARLLRLVVLMEAGHPYLLWPLDEGPGLPGEASARFKAGMAAWLAEGVPFDDWPEALLQAVQDDRLGATALLVDEADRNPYDAASALVPLASAGP